MGNLAKYNVALVRRRPESNTLSGSKTRNTPSSWGVSCFGIRQRPTLPGRLQPSTIGAERLNFCVRYGNRWIPFAIVTGILSRACAVRRSLGLRCVHFKPQPQTWEPSAHSRFLLLFARTLKTAHPDFLHLAKNQSLTSIFPLVSLDSQFLWIKSSTD